MRIHVKIKCQNTVKKTESRILRISVNKDRFKDQSNEPNVQNTSLLNREVTPGPWLQFSTNTENSTQPQTLNSAPNLKLQPLARLVADRMLKSRACGSWCVRVCDMLSRKMSRCSFPPIPPSSPSHRPQWALPNLGQRWALGSTGPELPRKDPGSNRYQNHTKKAEYIQFKV